MSLELSETQTGVMGARSAPLDEEAVYARLSTIFDEIFDAEIDLTPGTTAQDVEGWDSFAHINLILTIESKFGVRFKTSDVERMRSVGDLASFILRQRAN